MRDIKLYTDGSFNRDHKNICGHASVILINDKVFVLYGGITSQDYTSMWNVGGEIYAVLNSLRFIVEKLNIQNAVINLYYDYEGIEKWISKKWKSKKMITKKYYNEVKNMCEKFNIKLAFNKIKSHSGNKYNDIADIYAKKAISKILNNENLPNETYMVYL